MNFQEAMAEIFNGHKVRRKAWLVTDYLTASDINVGHPRVVTDSGDDYSIFEFDLKATDWIISDEIKLPYYFSELIRGVMKSNEGILYFSQDAGANGTCNFFSEEDTLLFSIPISSLSESIQDELSKEIPDGWYFTKQNLQ